MKKKLQFAFVFSEKMWEKNLVDISTLKILNTVLARLLLSKDNRTLEYSHCDDLKNRINKEE